MSEPNKAILKIADTKLVLEFDVAVQVARILCAENLQKLTQEYKKDEVSGNYGYVDRISKVKMDEVAVSFIPAVDYFRLCEEGDKS
jgi:hypothetical protein